MASSARTNYPINLTLRRDIATQIPSRAARLGLTHSGYAAALVWNDSVQPAPALTALDSDPRFSRVDFGISLRAPLRKLATRQARARKLPLNAYLEALFAADLTDPAANFTIIAATLQ